MKYIYFFHFHSTFLRKSDSTFGNPVIICLKINFYKIWQCVGREEKEERKSSDSRSRPRRIADGFIVPTLKKAELTFVVSN